MAQEHDEKCPKGSHTIDAGNSDCFQSAFDSDLYSDVVVKAGDATFKAHKVVLAAHSDSFQAMFQASLQHLTQAGHSIQLL